MTDKITKVGKFKISVDKSPFRYSLNDSRERDFKEVRVETSVEINNKTKRELEVVVNESFHPHILLHVTATTAVGRPTRMYSATYFYGKIKDFHNVPTIYRPIVVKALSIAHEKLNRS